LATTLALKWYYQQKLQTNKVNAQVENKNRAYAVGITIGIHALLLLLCLFIVFITPIPAFEIKEVPEVEVELGFEGRGSMDSGGSGTPETSSQTPANSAPQQPSTSSPSVIVDNNDNDQSVSVKTNPKPSNATSDATPTETQPQVNPRLQALIDKANARKNGKGGSGGGDTGGDGKGKGGGIGDGDGDGHGNGGKPGGNGGHGDYNLAGRRLINKPQRMTDSREAGTVIVEIIVNSEGKVIKAKPGQRGSTTTSANLYAKATQAAYSAKFDPSPTGATEQRGFYTFVFVLE
jgi:periplasmic protein TonB